MHPYLLMQLILVAFFALNLEHNLAIYQYMNHDLQTSILHYSLVPLKMQLDVLKLLRLLLHQMVTCILFLHLYLFYYTLLLFLL